MRNERLLEASQVLFDDTNTVIRKRAQNIQSLPKMSGVDSSWPDMVTLQDEFYAAKSDWMSKAESVLSQRPTEEQVKEMKEKDPAKAQYNRVPRPDYNLKRLRRKKRAEAKKDAKGKDSDLSGFANLTIDDGEPLASDEEYVEMPDLDAMDWKELMKKKSHSPQSKGKK